jgi:hypothetical protein
MVQTETAQYRCLSCGYELNTTVEARVAARIQERAARGLNKYGVSMERTDLTTLDWLRHAQEEALDLAVYLEKVIALEVDKGGK